MWNLLILIYKTCLIFALPKLSFFIINDMNFSWNDIWNFIFMGKTTSLYNDFNNIWTPLISLVSVVLLFLTLKETRKQSKLNIAFESINKLDELINHLEFALGNIGYRTVYTEWNSNQHSLGYAKNYFEFLYRDLNYLILTKKKHDDIIEIEGVFREDSIKELNKFLLLLNKIMSDLNNIIDLNIDYSLIHLPKEKLLKLCSYYINDDYKNLIVMKNTYKNIDIVIRNTDFMHTITYIEKIKVQQYKMLQLNSYLKL